MYRHGPAGDLRRPATLDSGKTQVYKITVQLDPAYSGDGKDIRNQGTVKSDTVDPDTSNNTSDASTGGLPGPGPQPNPRPRPTPTSPSPRSPWEPHRSRPAAPTTTRSRSPTTAPRRRRASW
ncbi:hypothetical protein ACFQ0T_09455 [Kitasatospora gansuensis]